MTHLERWLLLKTMDPPDPAWAFRQSTIRLWFWRDNWLTRFLYWWGQSAACEITISPGRVSAFLVRGPFLTGLASRGVQ